MTDTKTLHRETCAFTAYTSIKRSCIWRVRSRSAATAPVVGVYPCASIVVYCNAHHTITMHNVNQMARARVCVWVREVECIRDDTQCTLTDCRVCVVRVIFSPRQLVAEHFQRCRAQPDREIYHSSCYCVVLNAIDAMRVCIAIHWNMYVYNHTLYNIIIPVQRLENTRPDNWVCVALPTLPICV